MSVKTATSKKTESIIERGSCEIRVRYAECDAMGIAHHGAYPVWFEMGRTELYRESGTTYRELEAQGLHLAVAALEVRYKAPVRYDEVLGLETTLVERTRFKLVHRYRLFRNGLMVATGRTVLGCVDGHGKLTPLPEDDFGPGR